MLAGRVEQAVRHLSVFFVLLLGEPVGLEEFRQVLPFRVVQEEVPLVVTSVTMVIPVVRGIWSMLHSVGLGMAVAAVLVEPG